MSPHESHRIPCEVPSPYSMQVPVHETPNPVLSAFFEPLLELQLFRMQFERKLLSVKRTRAHDDVRAAREVPMVRAVLIPWHKMPLARSGGYSSFSGVLL